MESSSSGHQTKSVSQSIDGTQENNEMRTNSADRCSVDKGGHDESRSPTQHRTRSAERQLKSRIRPQQPLNLIPNVSNREEDRRRRMEQRNLRGNQRTEEGSIHGIDRSLHEFFLTPTRNSYRRRRRSAHTHGTPLGLTGGCTLQGQSGPVTLLLGREGLVDL
jgi:hypothetical protein